MCQTIKQTASYDQQPLKCTLDHNEILPSFTLGVRIVPVWSLEFSENFCNMIADGNRCLESDAQRALLMGKRFGLFQVEPVDTVERVAKNQVPDNNSQNWMQAK